MPAAKSDDEWTTVTEESATRIIWDTPGKDQWIGTYIGHDMVQNDQAGEVYDYLLFRGTDGKLYSMSNSYKLRETFGDGHTGEKGKVSEGTKVRLRYVKDVEIKGKNPMKDIAVDVASK